MGDEYWSCFSYLVCSENECGGINDPTFQERWLLVIEQNDPLSVIIRPRLLFTRGYHLELNINDANAIETYLELIQLAPRSYWSWLAWLWLETAENVN